MEQTSITLNVFFDGHFFAALLERSENGRLSVCRIVFGPEPKDYEVYEFMLKNWRHFRFSPPVRAQAKEKPANPKRAQREVARRIGAAGISTKSQQALSLQREQSKQEHREKSRAEREAEKEEAFRLRQEKRKEKHRGH